MSKQYRIRNQTVSVTSADGVSGILCRDIEGRYFFRIYHGEFIHGDVEFTDYDLAHFDLAVTIHDESAAFYHFSDRQILDHDPATLGLEEVADDGDSG